MADTPRLTLPYISSSQSQKEVSHNESLNILDALLQATALNYTATPPGSPAAGDLYLVGASPTGAWSGHPQAVALYIGSTWEFHTPEEGWLCYDQTANVLRRYDGSTWGDLLASGAYTDEQAQDAVGAMLADTATIDLTYTDATPELKADVKTNSLDETHLKTSVAGAGLTGGNGTALAVQVDGTTIEISSDTLRLTAGSPSGNGGKDLRVNSGGTALEYYSSPYDVGGTFAGTPTANLVILRYPMPRAVVFPTSLTGSQGVCGTGPSSQTDFDMLKNGSSFGTMRFAPSGTVASFISASGATFAAGDILTVVAPAALNGLADLGFALAGTR